MCFGLLCHEQPDPRTNFIGCVVYTLEMPGVIENMGASVLQRKMLFLGICVPLRLGIAYAASTTHTRQWFAYVAAAFSAVAIYINASKAADASVWWSRRTHAAHALGVLVLVALPDTRKYVPYVLFSDVLFGVLSSFMWQPSK